MKSLLLLSAFLFLMLSNVHAQVSLTAKGTGNTTGHIANLTLTNSGNKAETITVPNSVIPSDGMHQGFVVTTPIEVKVAGNSVVTVGVNGYCTNANLPAPDPGSVFPSPNGWDSSSPLVKDAINIIRVTKEYQHTSQFTTPFHINPEKEIANVVQEVIWMHTSTPVSPYTLDDLCDRTTTLFITATGRAVTSLTPAEQKSIDYGISQVIDAVTKVGEGAGIPAFQPTAIPSSASFVNAAPPSSDPDIAKTILVTSTGHTTGHIADLKVSNPTDDPVSVQIGDGAMYIPDPSSLDRGRDAYQGFVTQGIPAITLAPGETKTVPVNGYCADIRVPPLASGGALPNVPNWISPGPYHAPSPSSPGSSTPTLVSIPTRTSMSLSETVELLRDLPSRPAGPSSAAPCPEGPYVVVPLLPGTDRPVPFPLNPEDQPGAAVPLLLDALSKITRTYDEMRSKGSITTPFSGNPEKEREAVIQQSFWRYSAELSGKPYEKKDFKAMTFQQFEQNSGKPVEKLPEPEREKLEVGVEDFWNTFEAVGSEAKILPTVPAVPMTVPSIDEFWNDFDAGDTKLKGTGAPERDPNDPDQIVGDPNDPPVLIKDEKTQKQCECGNISFDLLIWNTEVVPPNGWRGVQENKYQSKVDLGSKAGLPDHEINAGKKGLKKGSAQIVELKNIEFGCSCVEITEAINDAIAALAKLEKSNRTKLDKAKSDLVKKEADLKAAKEKRRPIKATIDRLTREVDDLIAKVKELETPIAEKQNEIEKLKKDATVSDCPAYESNDNRIPFPSVKVTDDGKNVDGKWGDAPNVWDYKFTVIKGDAALECKVVISFYCKGEECKEVQCSRTIVIKIDE